MAVIIAAASSLGSPPCPVATASINAAMSVVAKPLRMHDEDSGLNAPVCCKNGVKYHRSRVSSSMHVSKAAASSSVAVSGIVNVITTLSSLTVSVRHASSASDMSSSPGCESIFISGVSASDLGAGVGSGVGIDVGVGVGVDWGVGEGVGAGVCVFVGIGVRATVGSGVGLGGRVARGVGVGVGVGDGLEQASKTAVNSNATKGRNFNLYTPNPSLGIIEQMKRGYLATNHITRPPYRILKTWTSLQQFLPRRRF